MRLCLRFCHRSACQTLQAPPSSPGIRDHGRARRIHRNILLDLVDRALRNRSAFPGGVTRLPGGEQCRKAFIVLIRLGLLGLASCARVRFLPDERTADEGGPAFEAAVLRQVLRRAAREEVGPHDGEGGDHERGRSLLTQLSNCGWRKPVRSSGRSILASKAIGTTRRTKSLR